MLIAIDGMIYKYDLASKDVLYQFKAGAFKAMKLFDRDTKIITADQT
jgi:hypothetical protein